MNFLTDAAFYLFYPNPGNVTWSSPKVMLITAVCAAMVALSFGVRAWRKSLKNPVTKKLSRSWFAAGLTFGLSGLLLAACRVNTVQFLSMRILWVVWAILVLWYAYVQVRVFRARHYVIVAPVREQDPRAKYLP